MQSIAGVSPGVGGTIKRIRYFVTNPVTYSTSYQPHPNYQICMKNHTSVSTNPGNVGWTTVYGPTSHYNVSVGWTTIDIPDFQWSGGHLSFAFAWGAVPRYSQDGQNYVFSNPNNAYCWSSWTDSPGTYTCASSAYSNRNSVVPRIEIEF